MTQSIMASTRPSQHARPVLLIIVHPEIPRMYLSNLDESPRSTDPAPCADHARIDPTTPRYKSPRH